MKKYKLISLIHQFYKECKLANEKGYSILPLLSKFPTYLKQNRTKKDRLELGIPWLVQNVVEFLEEYIQKDQKVFEFGAGASSIYFLSKGTQLTSVEHDKEWFSKINHLLLKRGFHNFSLNLIEPEFLNWNPNSVKSERDIRFLDYDYSKYSDFILNYPDNYFDIVLIDGRVRVECLRNSLNKVKETGIIILDNSERPDYAEKLVHFNLKLVFKSFGFVQYDLGFTETSVFQRGNFRDR